MNISVENLIKRYDNFLALDRVNLVMEEQQIYGILGNYNSGKTTLLHCIIDEKFYDKGKVTFKIGRDVINIKKYTKEIGIVSKNIVFLKGLTVNDNLMFFALLYENNKLKAFERVKKVIKDMELHSCTKLSLEKLSEGQLARLNYSCGIINNPKLLLLDEPVYHVDTYSKELILHDIKERRNKGSTILYFTQSVEEVENICQKACILQRGKCIAQGTLPELKAMISYSEIIRVELFQINPKVIQDISEFISIADIKYYNNELIIKSKKGTNNLLLILDYMQSNNIHFGKVYTQIPSLNDVFSEITGENKIRE